MPSRSSIPRACNVNLHWKLIKFALAPQPEALVNKIGGMNFSESTVMKGSFLNPPPPPPPPLDNFLFLVTLPTLIIYLGPIQAFLKPFGILKSSFRLSLKIIYFFHTKSFYLPTN